MAVRAAAKRGSKGSAKPKTNLDGLSGATGDGGAPPKVLSRRVFRIVVEELVGNDREDDESVADPRQAPPTPPIRDDGAPTSSQAAVAITVSVPPAARP